VENVGLWERINFREISIEHQAHHKTEKHGQAGN
jgi:hypothetical protein